MPHDARTPTCDRPIGAFTFHMPDEHAEAAEPRVVVRETTREDFPGIIALCERVYPDSPCWSEYALASHLELFSEGQFVAIDRETGDIVGMAASLIVRWNEYDMTDSWRDFTDSGMFTNHDPENGRTLYGAEIMVDPDRQGLGVGGALYEAREALTRRLGLKRIRAGARIPGFGAVAESMSAREYVSLVERGLMRDATLSFQLNRGFTVVAIVDGYLRGDSESQGWAVVIEWKNPDAPENQE